MLKSKSFAVTVAVFWSFFVFLIVLLSAFGLEADSYRVLNSLYLNLIPSSIPGAFVGALYGAGDGLISGFLFAELYNFLAFREKIAGNAG